MALNYAELRGRFRKADTMGGKALSAPRLAITIGLLALAMALLLTSCSMAAEPSIDMAIIATIESSNNPLAYNKGSKARGLCQITPIVLKEYDQTYGEKHTVEMLFDREFNMQVADWYMNFKIPAYLHHYKIADTVTNRLIAYNAGIGTLVKNRKNSGVLPKETSDYIKKYQQLLKDGAQ